MNNKNLFSENKVKKSTIKYFVISFSIFIVLIAVCSVVLLMHSLDYDIDNLVDNSTTTTTGVSDETDNNIYSVNELTGKSNLLFIVENEEKSVDFLCVVSTDFDNKSMIVNCIDGNSKMQYNGLNSTVNSIYSKDYEIGIKKALYDSGFSIDKYIIFNQNQLEDVLSIFNGFSINVQSAVNYKSHDFNLILEAGIQELSPDLTYKYLKISDVSTREKILCDIIKSVLTADYADDSEKLFTSFVNLCKTDISVIDYSETIDRLTAYCYADDKFYPEVYVEGDEL